MIVIVANPEQFTDKGKQIPYIRSFVELYNWKNRKQVHEIYGMVELEKMCTSTTKNPYNLGTHHILEISSILRNVHVIPKDQERIVFFVNNYID